jgi:NADH:ubiquinone oxidoreductase subunit D
LAQLFKFWKSEIQEFSHLNSIKTFILNFGPQHPASHGVLRLILELNGEYIEKADANIGFLHRGSEKLMEIHKLNQNSIFFDRLDYTSVLTQTHAYCLTVETGCLNYKVNILTLALRCIFDELARMLNHLLAISTHALDVGSMVQLFWAFEEREQIMELYEYLSGARMHCAIYNPNQNLDDYVDDDFFYKVLFFLRNCYKAYIEMFISLFNNRVWKLRLINVGELDIDEAIYFGATGPILRSTGSNYDLRMSIINTYSVYWFLNFRTFIGSIGDSFDRFLIRSRELFESMYIIYQVISTFFFHEYNYNICIETPIITGSQEDMINHFINIQNDLDVETIFNYSAVEAGKGEFGVFLYYNIACERIYIRSPAYNHLQLIGKLACGATLADVVTIIGTLDIVFGEVDR